MTQKPLAQKDNSIVRAFIDLLVVGLLMIGSGFGGYYWGVHQKMAPVLTVPPGTPGALPPPIGAADPSPARHTPTTTAVVTKQKTEDPPVASASESGSKKEKKGKTKYWISSSGSDYVGYNITVRVNGEAVDSFFGPGKNVDISRFVKQGDNTVSFDAKALGEQYNKHTGDAAAILTVQIVKGPHVQDEYKPSDVLVTYKRTAVENQDFNDSMQFTGD
jgi:hypothetical protein